MDPSTFNLTLQVLNELVKSADIKKLIRNHVFDSYIDSIANLLNLANLNSSFIYLAFVESIACAICKTQRCQLSLDCYHKFCVECIKIHINPNSQNFIEKDFAFSCPICKSAISLADKRNLMNHILDQDIIDNRTVCDQCKMKRYQDAFYCTCHHTCIYCIIKSLSLGQKFQKCECLAINQIFESQYIEKCCNGCKDLKNAKESLFFEICDNHTHCYDCLLTA